MGIQINGATDSITAIDGTIDVVSAIGNAGVVTATAFVGNITGNVTGNINHTSNLELQVGGVTRAHFNSSGHFNVAGISTFTGNAYFGSDIYLTDDSGGYEKVEVNVNDVRFEHKHLHSEFGVWTRSTSVTDRKNGIESGGTDLRLYSNSTEKVRIDSSGRLGIGTDNPTEDLHITGNTPVIRLEDSDTSRQSQIVGIDGNLRFDADNGNAQADTNISFRTDGSERLRIASDGDLLITGSDNAELKLKCGTSTGNGIIAFLNSSGTTKGNIFYDSDNNFMVFKTNGTASSNERIRITSSGFIGMGGNTNPTNVLHIKTAVTNTAVITLESTATDSYPFLRLKNDAKEYQLTCHGVLSDAFTIYDGTAGSHRFLITSGGQVVVGGTSSQASDAVTLMPDGEVTAAGFYFSNNIGSAMNACGIRRHTTNTMVFDTASTERLRIDADGNTSTKGSAMEHFVNKKVQSINSNGNSVQYVLIAPTGTNNLRLQGKFHFTRATGTSGIAQQTVDAQIMTNNTGGDAQYYVRTSTTDGGSYAGIYYRWVTCDYNSTTYYALEGHPTTGSSYWGGFMQHGVYTGTANACTNLGTVLNTTSHSISNITALTTRKAHERWYNTNLNVQGGALYVKQASGLNGGYFAPLYYDVNGAALPTQMKVHGQKAVCIDCTRYYTSGDIITFRINNDYEGAIYVNPSGVQYNTTSDYRLKENVINLTGAIDRVKQLKPKRFNFIKDPGNTIDGFMAHEVSSVVPNAVVGEKDAVKDILYEENDEVIPEGKKVGDVKEKDAIDPQSMDDSKLVPLLTAALQEAIAKIETLETKVAALEGS